jgi:hypothetical protein
MEEGKEKKINHFSYIYHFTGTKPPWFLFMIFLILCLLKIIIIICIARISPCFIAVDPRLTQLHPTFTGDPTAQLHLAASCRVSFTT